MINALLKEQIQQFFGSMPNHLCFYGIRKTHFITLSQHPYAISLQVEKQIISGKIISIFKISGGAIVIGMESIVYHDGINYTAVAPPIIKVLFLLTGLQKDIPSNLLTNILAKHHKLLCKG